MRSFPTLENRWSCFPLEENEGNMVWKIKSHLSFTSMPRAWCVYSYPNATPLFSSPIQSSTPRTVYVPAAADSHSAIRGLRNQVSKCAENPFGPNGPLFSELFPCLPLVFLVKRPEFLSAPQFISQLFWNNCKIS